MQANGGLSLFGFGFATAGEYLRERRVHIYVASTDVRPLSIPCTLGRARSFARTYALARARAHAHAYPYARAMLSSELTRRSGRSQAGQAEADMFCTHVGARLKAVAAECAVDLSIVAMRPIAAEGRRAVRTCLDELRRCGRAVPCNR